MKDKIVLLIVDDDEDDRDLFIESAKEVGEHISCISANDGEDALRILKDPANALPDFIFLDLRMPKISGKRCLGEIKKDPRLKNIPVFIYTTSREIEDSDDTKLLGAAHFISKPVNPEEIYYLISSAISENWQQDNPQAYQKI